MYKHTQAASLQDWVTFQNVFNQVMLLIHWTGNKLVGNGAAPKDLFALVEDQSSSAPSSAPSAYILLCVVTQTSTG